MRQEKRKKKGGEKAKSKSQDCCVTYKRKNYLKILLSAHTKTIFYSLAVLVCKILFLPRENKIHIRVMVFLLYRQKDIDKIIDFICQKVIVTAQTYST